MNITKEYLDAQYQKLRDEYWYLYHQRFGRFGCSKQDYELFRHIEKECHNFHRRYNKLFWKQFNKKCK